MDSQPLMRLSATEIVEKYEPDLVAELPESSWGAGGNDFTWMNPETKWMWPIIHDAEMTAGGLHRFHAIIQLKKTGPAHDGLVTFPGVS